MKMSQKSEDGSPEFKMCSDSGLRSSVFRLISHDFCNNTKMFYFSGLKIISLWYQIKSKKLWQLKRQKELLLF